MANSAIKTFANGAVAMTLSTHDDEPIKRSTVYEVFGTYCMTDERSTVFPDSEYSTYSKSTVDEESYKVNVRYIGLHNTSFTDSMGRTVTNDEWICDPLISRSFGISSYLNQTNLGFDEIEAPPEYITTGIDHHGSTELFAGYHRSGYGECTRNLQYDSNPDWQIRDWVDYTQKYFHGLYGGVENVTVNGDSISDQIIDKKWEVRGVTDAPTMTLTPYLSTGRLADDPIDKPLYRVKSGREFSSATVTRGVAPGANQPTPDDTLSSFNTYVESDCVTGGSYVTWDTTTGISYETTQSPQAEYNQLKAKWVRSSRDILNQYCSTILAENPYKQYIINNATTLASYTTSRSYGYYTDYITAETETLTSADGETVKQLFGVPFDHVQPRLKMDISVNWSKQIPCPAVIGGTMQVESILTWSIQHPQDNYVVSEESLANAGNEDTESFWYYHQEGRSLTSSPYNTDAQGFAAIVDIADIHNEISNTGSGGVSWRNDSITMPITQANGGLDEYPMTQSCECSWGLFEKNNSSKEFEVPDLIFGANTIIPKDWLEENKNLLMKEYFDYYQSLFINTGTNDIPIYKIDYSQLKPAFRDNWLWIGGGILYKINYPLPITDYKYKLQIQRQLKRATGIPSANHAKDPTVRRILAAIIEARQSFINYLLNPILCSEDGTSSTENAARSNYLAKLRAIPSTDRVRSIEMRRILNAVVRVNKAKLPLYSTKQSTMRHAIPGLQFIDDPAARRIIELITEPLYFETRFVLIRTNGAQSDNVSWSKTYQINFCPGKEQFNDSKEHIKIIKKSKKLLK